MGKSAEGFAYIINIFEEIHIQLCSRSQFLFHADFEVGCDFRLQSGVGNDRPLVRPVWNGSRHSINLIQQGRIERLPVGGIEVGGAVVA